jgi:alpha-mannosidase
MCDLLTAQFHDILPGTSVQPAEEASLRLIDHGLEIAARLKARAFFALAAGEPKAAPREYPILVYNPHPFPVKGVFECEFMLEDQNWEEEFSLPVVFQEGKRLPSQPEKEMSNLTLDWRKRVVFQADLSPSSMNRFDCRIEKLDRKPVPGLKERDGRYTFHTDELTVVINSHTGLVDEYTARGVSYLKPDAFAPLIIEDNEDPWRMDTNAFAPVIGRFELMDRGAGTDFSGVKQVLLPSVRVIEDGEVRTVIESVLRYNGSYICQTYKLPKRGTEIEVQLHVYWNEKDKMLKLSIPTVFTDGQYRGQTAFGISELPGNGDEAVAQKWVAVQSTERQQALTCINDGIYGSDYREGEIRLSLLRGAGYCAHPINDRPILVQDRFLPRMDQGERCYSFRLNAGELTERQRRVDREAIVHNEKCYALSFFPSGDGKKNGPFLVLEDETVQLSALKKEERGDGYIVRLFEPTGHARATVLTIPSFGIREGIRLSGFEIKTFRIDAQNKTISEIGLCEDLTQG